jgi:hypothetical protein
VARPWPGKCFTTGNTPPAFQALGDCLGNFRDLARFAAIGTIADDGVAAGSRNIRDRKAIDVDAERS